MNTTNLIPILAYAHQVRVGDKIIGRRDYHLVVEKVSHSSAYVTIEGVNGWGEPMTMRYGKRDPIDIINY